MRSKNIELELRAKIDFKNLDKIKKNLEKIAKKISKTNRLSVMFFGKINNKPKDIRVRITNDECELVIKTGSFYSPNRVEISQKIQIKQFIGIIKIFSQLGFRSEIGERETFNYEIPNNIIISLVTADKVAYIELEKMSDKKTVIKNMVELKKLAKNLNLKIMKEKEFNNFCKYLTDKVDKEFKNTPTEYKKLQKYIDNERLNK